MEICGNSMFDLLRNAFLIHYGFNDKGVTNPVRLTDAEGELIKQTSVNKADFTKTIQNVSADFRSGGRYTRL